MKRFMLWYLTVAGSALVLTSWAAKADDPPSAGITGVVLNEAADIQGTFDFLDDGTLVTTDPNFFSAIVEVLQSDHRFVASIIVNADPVQPVDGGGSGDPPKPQVVMKVYDADTLRAWNDTGFTPGFADQLVADPPPTVEEAVFDLIITTPMGDGTIEQITTRVRKSDGAAAVVSDVVVGTYDATSPNLATCGGFWHNGNFCCNVSYGICYVIHYFVPSLCGNCSACKDNCVNCSVSNPCHACDPCGLIWLLCRFVPNAHC